MLEQLSIVAALCWIFALQEDMCVGVDQTGEHSNLRPKRDGCGPGRWLAALAHAFNLVATNHDENVMARLRGDAVDQVGGTDDRDFVGSWGRGLARARAEKTTQDSGQNGNAAYHVVVPPVSERTMNTLLKRI